MKVQFRGLQIIQLRGLIEDLELGSIDVAAAEEPEQGLLWKHPPLGGASRGGSEFVLWDMNQSTRQVSSEPPGLSFGCFQTEPLLEIFDQFSSASAEEGELELQEDGSLLFSFGDTQLRLEEGLGI